MSCDVDATFICVVYFLNITRYAFIARVSIIFVLSLLYEFLEIILFTYLLDKNLIILYYY